MRAFLKKYPPIVAAVVFLIIFIGGGAAGLLYGLSFMGGPCKPPCDGGAMAAGFVWQISFMASLILGTFAGLATFIYLRMKSR
jgi:hypothetical protein